MPANQERRQEGSKNPVSYETVGKNLKATIPAILEALGTEEKVTLHNLPLGNKETIILVRKTVPGPSLRANRGSDARIAVKISTLSEALGKDVEYLSFEFDPDVLDWDDHDAGFYYGSVDIFNDDETTTRFSEALLSWTKS